MLNGLAAFPTHTTKKSARFTVPIVQHLALTKLHHGEHGEHRAFISKGAKCLLKIGSVVSVLSVVRFLMPFEKLHRALVLFGSLQALECTEVAPLPRLRILLAGIQPITARAQFPNHRNRPLTIDP